jgi:hypothetical protein
MGNGEETYPCGGEEEYVNAHERNTSFLRTEILGEDITVGVLTRGGCSEDCDEELRDCHPDGY